MKKAKIVFLCNECGYESSGWLGKCPSCGVWNSFVEFNPEPAEKRYKRGASKRAGENNPTPLTGANKANFSEVRACTGLLEFDRVLGGGIVRGSVILLSGDPGIGKSTLLLHTSDFLAQRYGKVLYVSGEESTEQIAMRASRLNVDNSNLFIFAESDVDEVCDKAIEVKPVLLVIDSIQTMYTKDSDGIAGGISQVKESATRLMQLAKTSDIPVVLVGHVNKAGDIAGPRVFEHMVDTVIHFEGDSNYAYRILRAIKNRFGSTNEVGIFEMVEEGLREVQNPSDLLLKESVHGASGSAIVASLEGTRPILIEVQSLVVKSQLATPRRMTTGVDYNRASIITAVLDKRVGIHLGDEDIYISVTGGLKLSEPAADLGVAVAIVSSFKGIPAIEKTVFFGEIGLSGEIRAITKSEIRIAEAARLGFKRCIMPDNNLKTLDVNNVCDKYDMKIIGVKTLRQAISEALNI